MDEADSVLVDLMGKDHSNVGYVQRRRCNIENCSGGLGRPDRNTIEAYAEEHHEPDRVDGG